MLPLSHVVLHVGLCNAIARLKPETQIALRVNLTDRIGRSQVTKVYRFERGDDPEAVVEFDSAFGIYRIDLQTAGYGCSATGYLFFISGHDRSVTENLSDPPAPPPPTPVLLSGTAPQSFLYVQPTFVLFDKSAVACNKPVAQPLPANISVENDQDGYYAQFDSGPANVAPGSQMLALRLRTPTHQYHYVRIPIPFPMPWGGWPSSIEFNVSQDMVDSIAGDPVNTLLCPRLWRTSAG